jgi:hypothetical protein
MLDLAIILAPTVEPLPEPVPEPTAHDLLAALDNAGEPENGR